MTRVYTGRYIHVDLTQRTWKIVPIAEEDIRRFTLGSGYAAWLYWQEMDPTVPPLDPRSKLYVFNGLLSGTFAPTACRSSWAGRSPLTGIWGESSMGGHWAAELRFSGFDGLVIEGQADEPVYIWIDGPSERVEIRPAGHVWGKGHFDTFDILREETDPKAQVACIGPAGEHLVLYASVMQGGRYHARAAGRTGMGALMGSKRLKAIVVRGKDRPTYADPKGFRALVREANSSIKEYAKSLSLLGTAGGVPATEEYGDLPLRNWRDGTWGGRSYEISGQKIAETIFWKHTFCFACPIGCGKAVDIKEGPYKGTKGEGPEYETLAGFGGMLLNDDLESIAYINHLCNDFGLDTISTSASIAFAVEAFERGYLTEKDTDGLTLAWGDPQMTIELVKKIAFREGFGNFVADGVRRMSQALGPETDRFAVHVKGLEVPYHDPRAFVDMAANYATANRGACHMESCSYWQGYGLKVPDLYYEAHPDRFASREAGRMAKRYQDYVALYNTLGLCKFIIKGLAGPALVADLVNKALGWNWDVEEVYRTGERIFNLKRLINGRLGIRAADDRLPYRLEHEPRPDGSAAGVLPDMSIIMPEYYEARGWDPETGMPTAETLEALGLSDLLNTPSS